MIKKRTTVNTEHECPSFPPGFPKTPHRRWEVTKVTGVTVLHGVHAPAKPFPTPGHPTPGHPSPGHPTPFPLPNTSTSWSTPQSSRGSPSPADPPGVTGHTPCPSHLQAWLQHWTECSLLSPRPHEELGKGSQEGRVHQMSVLPSTAWGPSHLQL